MSQTLQGPKHYPYNGHHYHGKCNKDGYAVCIECGHEENTENNKLCPSVQHIYSRGLEDGKKINPLK